MPVVHSSLPHAMAYIFHPRCLDKLRAAAQAGWGWLVGLAPSGGDSNQDGPTAIIDCICPTGDAEPAASQLGTSWDT